MKVVMPGGTGQVGTILNRALTAAGHDVVILTRGPVREREVRWDGETLGPWAQEWPDAAGDLVRRACDGSGFTG